MKRGKIIKYEICKNEDKPPYLLVAIFNNNGEKFVWYPKWSEITNLIEWVFYEECEINNGKNINYLIFSLLKTLMLESARENLKQNINKRKLFNDLSNALSNITDK